MSEINEGVIRRELIANAGNQLGQVVNETQDSVESQKAKASSIIEMVYALNKSVDNIHEATNVIDETSRNLETQSQTSVEGIQQVSEQLKAVEERFAPIFESIDLIDSIAENTKLLAVNATIQAAKAGVAGRSFAVVAKEIQELSTSTQKTNLSITENIDGLKKTMGSLSQSLVHTVKSLQEMQNGALSNKEKVDQVVNETMYLSQQMSDTHSSSLQIKDATEDLSISFREVTTINDTFNAILALMSKKQIFSERNDAMSLYEKLASESDLLDANRFSASEEEYVLTEQDILISSTDTKGVITYGNRTFYNVAQFEKSEMDGEPHSIIRHPDMPKSAFKHLWDTIQNGDLWQGIVLNRGKLGRVYWVRAIVFPVYQQNKIVGYLSVRSKPTSEEISRAKQAYQRLP